MNVFYTLFSLLFKLIFGALAEMISIKILMILGASAEIFVYYFFLYRNQDVVKPIYNQTYEKKVANRLSFHLRWYKYEAYHFHPTL